MNSLPPRGWNSYDAYGCSVTESEILENANFIVNSGMLSHGWKFVVVDAVSVA